METSGLNRTVIKIFFAGFVIAVAYLNISGIHHQSDDFFFSQVAKESNTLNWLIFRYHNWSSRTVIEYALVTVINHKIVWSVLNSLFIGLTFSCVAYLTSANSRQALASSAAFLFSLMCALKKGFLKDGALWMTGSINYLWPVALSLLGFSLIKYYATQKQSTPALLVASLAFFLSSFNEQVIVANLILLLSVLALRFERTLKITLPSLILTFLVLVYILTCPGNEVRFISEVHNQYPDFMSLGLFSKLLLGINLSFDQLTIIQPVVFILMYGTLFLITKNKTAKYLALILLFITVSLFMLNRVIPFVMPHTTVKIFTPVTVLGFTSFLRVFGLAVISLLTCATLYLGLKQNQRKPLLIIYICSFSGTVMLGLSPTLYASGERIFYTSAIMISALSAYLVTQAIQTLKHNRRSSAQA
jgi:hypothetical protein